MRKVDSSDYGFLYGLLKERNKIVNITHQKMPTRKESDKFNANKHDLYDLIILKNDERIGNVRITKRGEVGIFLKKKYQDQDIGTTTMWLLFGKANLKEYYANISPLNIRSQRFFESLGFKLISYTYKKIE